MSKREPEEEANCGPALDVGIGESNSEFFFFCHSTASRSDSSRTVETPGEAAAAGFQLFDRFFDVDVDEKRGNGCESGLDSTRL